MLIPSIMDISKLRVGYVPIHPELDAPGDKRRFGYYAREKNIPFEIARPDQTYDLVVLSQSADLSVWSRIPKGRTKIVYDLIDSYLSLPAWQPKSVLRGLAKYSVGASKRLDLNYREAIVRMCRRADAVICSTEEQRKQISQYCLNVSIILDVHSGITTCAKENYETKGRFNLVWEGQAENVASFLCIAEALHELRKRFPIALHLVTDLEYALYMRKYFRRSTSKFIRKIIDASYLYEWNEATCANLITACDIAVIPIDLTNPMAAGKPENKLLLFWRLGIPTVVSASPAYSRAMAHQSLPLACRTPEDWIEKLGMLFSSREARRAAGQGGKRFAERVYSPSQITSLWDKTFQSIFTPEKTIPITTSVVEAAGPELGAF